MRVALVPVFETNEHAGHVLPIAAGAGANGSEHRLDVLLLVIEKVIFRLLHHTSASAAAVLPLGNWTEVVNIPRSSSGRNEVGKCRNRNTIPPSRTT